MITRAPSPEAATWGLYWLSCHVRQSARSLWEVVTRGCPGSLVDQVTTFVGEGGRYFPSLIHATLRSPPSFQEGVGCLGGGCPPSWTRGGRPPPCQLGTLFAYLMPVTMQVYYLLFTFMRWVLTLRPPPPASNSLGYFYTRGNQTSTKVVVGWVRTEPHFFLPALCAELFFFAS